MVGEKDGWGKPDEFGENAFGENKVVLSQKPKTIEELAALAAQKKLAEGKKVIVERGVDDPDLAGFIDRAGDEVVVSNVLIAPKRETAVDEFDDNVGANSVEQVDVGLHVMPETKDELIGKNKIIKPKNFEKRNLRYESEFKGLEDKLIGILEQERDYIVEDVSISRDKNGRYVLTVKFKQRGPRGKKIRSLQITGSSHSDLEKTVSQESLGLPQARKRR